MLGENAQKRLLSGGFPKIARIFVLVYIRKKMLPPIRPTRVNFSSPDLTFLFCLS